MATDSLRASTLSRLGRIETEGHPVLSVYIDLDASRLPTPGSREAEIGALLSSSGAPEDDIEAVRDLLSSDSELLRGAEGLAIFSSAQAGVLEAVSLSESVEPSAVVDSAVWLEPLAGLVASERWGVAVVSRRSARLFRGGPHALAEFAHLTDEIHRRHAQGGWSQARYQRGVEQQVSEHVQRTADQLLRAHRRSPFENVVVVAADELWPAVEGALHSDLRSRLVEHVALGLEHATSQEIQEALSPTFDRAAQERERALLGRLEQALGTGGPAVAGLDEVLATLEQERVETLLVVERADIPAGSCPRCGRLYSDSEGSCRLDEATLERVDGAARAIEMAASRSAEVVIIRHRAPALTGRGSIAALLRW